MSEEFQPADFATEEVMEEYEKVRQSGLTNMYDYYGVVRYADMLDCCELTFITRDEYKYILSNFGKLMKFYDIQQPDRKKEW